MPAGVQRTFNGVTIPPLVWHLIVAAGNDRAVRRILERVLAAIGGTAEIRAIERYYKEPGQFSIRFTTPLKTATPADVVFQALTDAQRLGAGWIVNGPIVYDNDRLDFGMVCAVNANGRFLVPGVVWAHVEI